MKKLVYMFHCLSIRKKLIFSFMALVIVPTLISLVFSYRMVNDILLEKISNANLDSLDRVVRRMDGLMDDMTYTLLNMSSNPELRKILISNMEFVQANNSEDMKSYEKTKKLEKINEVFDTSPLNMLMYSTYITLLSDNRINYGNWEGFYNYIPKLKETGWFSDLIKSSSGNVRWIGANQSLSEYMEQDFFMLEAAIPIKEGTYSLNNIGVLHMGVPEKAVYNILKSDDPQREVLLIDKNGEIMSCRDKALLKHSLGEMVELEKFSDLKKGWFVYEGVNNRKSIITYTTISKTDWKVVSITPYDRMFEQMYKTRNILIAVNILSIITFISIALVISASISNPIVYLSKKMRNVENGSLDEKADILYEDEVGKLSRSFNHMLDKVSNLLIQVKEQEKKKREAELEALQAQINPHFLFNTLSSIRWAAAASGDNKVEAMVLALTNLLKMSIKKGPDMITIQDELTTLRYYIELCKMKQGFCFDFEVSLDTRIMDLEVPRLLFQPIVENTILHGFEEKRTGGIIKITGELVDDDVKIYFEDNGKGMNQQRLKDVTCGVARKNPGNGSFGSIGISNVDERIKLNYGEKFGLSIESSLDRGTKVTLSMPYKRGNIVC